MLIIGPINSLEVFIIWVKKNCNPLSSCPECQFKIQLLWAFLTHFKLKDWNNLPFQTTWFCDDYLLSFLRLHLLPPTKGFSDSSYWQDNLQHFSSSVSGCGPWSISTTGGSHMFRRRSSDHHRRRRCRTLGQCGRHSEQSGRGTG